MPRDTWQVPTTIGSSDIAVYSGRLEPASIGYDMGMARPVWTGSISFGLVNVPVKAYTAVRDHDVHFNQLEKKSGVANPQPQGLGEVRQGSRR